VSCDLSTLSECTASLALDNKVMKGSSLKISSICDDKLQTNLTLDLGLDTDRFSLMSGGTIGVDSKKITSAYGQIVGGFNDTLFVGVRISNVFGKENDLLVKGSLAYQTRDSMTGIQVNDSLRTKFNYWQQVSSNVAVASTVAFDARPRNPDGKGVSVSVGATCEVDEDTTFLGKWSVDQKPAKVAEFRIGLAAEQRLTKNAVATFGVDLDAAKFLGGGVSGHTFGAKLAFE